MSSQFSCSRRKFCAAAAAGLAGLALPGCDPGGPRVTLGGVDTQVNGPGTLGTPPDLSGMQQQSGGDMAMQQQSSPDMAHQQTACGGSMMAGAASAIALNSSQLFTDGSGNKIYLCRDSGGLFSVDAHCTHAGRTVQQNGQGWFCPAHGATFAFDGTNPTAPAFTQLGNYAVCVDGSGNVTIDPNTTVAASTRV
jgi:Rieske Fe-S protein